MEKVKLIDSFFTAAEQDCRIAPVHISLYMALLQWCSRNGNEEPIAFYAKDLMPLAKFSSCTTLHKSIRDLDKFGYIRYVPSFNPFLGSLVYLSEGK